MIRPTHRSHRHLGLIVLLVGASACGSEAATGGSGGDPRPPATSKARPAVPTNPERPVEQTSPPARPTAPSESAPPAPPSLVQLHADEAVSQLIGTTYRRSPPGDLEQLGDFVVPEGSRLVGGASLSDSVHGVEWYRFRPGEIVVLLTKDLDVATPGGRDSQIVAGVSADAADEEFVLNGCSIGDRRQEDVLAVVASPRQLPEGASTTQVPASAAWRFDPSGETISALDASSVTCELVNP